VSSSSAAPAFGQADLSNCEREEIHLAGSIQPHGALLVVRESDRVIVQASENAPAFLGLNKGVVGRRLNELEGDLSACVYPQLDNPLLAIPVAVRCRLGSPPVAFDGLLHRAQGGGLVIELEQAGPPVELSRHVDGALQKIVASSTIRTLCDEAARFFKDLTGYDRVMVYRFDDDGHGEVYSELHEPGLEPYLGNRYPASDIPQMARRLYERNRVRVLVDVEYKAVAIAPRQSPVTGCDLDMSLCFLRSMSPIHIQYLKNMGVAATLVASLVVGGRLWGLIACHHYVPRFVHYQMRAVCELLSETIATRIAALESFAQAQADLTVRRLEQRMIEAISRDGDWRTALFDNSHALLHTLDATGAALLFEGQVLIAGEVPGTAQLREIGSWLDGKPRNPVVATASLGLDEPRFAPLTPVASGLLAAPVSNIPGEYLLWFRPERIRTVTWGGNPYKAIVMGNDPTELSPRRSFAQWHQVVEGTSEPWSPAELTAARLIGESVADIVLQFRAVRTLIVQDQLEHVTRQVRISEQPVIIANADGQILLTNEPWQQLLRESYPDPQWIEDLPGLFSDPDDVRHRLRDLIEQRRPWRGEIALANEEAGETRSFLVRADPVLSSPNRVLGFVILFADLTERKAAETARRRFQEEIIDRHRPMTTRLDSKSDLVYRNVLSAIVGNAQLAALEITDGVDPARMPAMLESVQVSVTRTAELLEHLMRHATHLSKKDK
jgi:light-regulated signal transduction histidine kinase (bacteriophytochrome)